MRARRLLLVAAAVLACTACHRKPAVAPLVPAPPRVVAVQPAARTTGYTYTGQIWALFDRALDPRSVDSTTVFLKQDTRRISAAVSYERLSRRIVVVPRVPLGLRLAYTVVLSGRVRAADGTALGQDYAWQFVTSSIRQASYVLPVPGQLASPVAALQWASPDATPGTLVFELYAGSDSAAVADRRVPYVYRGSGGLYLPRAYWPAGSNVYWAVTTEHLQTHERLVSPVTSFPVYPANAPTQDLVVRASDWGGQQAGNRTQYCGASVLNAGPGWIAGVRFGIGGALFPSNVARVRVRMNAVSGQSFVPSLGLSAALATWSACLFSYPLVPPADPSGPLALAQATSGSGLVFDSAALAAHVEATKRFPGLFGYLLTCPDGVVGLAAGSPDYEPPTMIVSYYP